MGCLGTFQSISPVIATKFLVSPRACWVDSWLEFSIAAHKWKIHFGRITSLVSIDFIRKINSHNKIGYFQSSLCPNSIPLYSQNKWTLQPLFQKINILIMFISIIYCIIHTNNWMRAVASINNSENIVSLLKSEWKWTQTHHFVFTVVWHYRARSVIPRVMWIWILFYKK